MNHYPQERLFSRFVQNYFPFRLICQRIIGSHANTWRHWFRFEVHALFLCRALARLQAEKLIEMEGRRLLVPDPERLIDEPALE